MNQLIVGGRPDDEAFKKATTDGITKSLSYLGFSADIFMGRWDDSKYVEGLRKAGQRQARRHRPAPVADPDQGGRQPARAEGREELNITWKSMQDELKQLNPPQLDYMKAMFARRRNELAPPAEPGPEAP